MKRLGAGLCLIVAIGYLSYFVGGLLPVTKQMDAGEQIFIGFWAILFGSLLLVGAYCLGSLFFPDAKQDRDY